jgi:ribonuclease BN (tRNA processing enzyme)
VPPVNVTFLGTGDAFSAAGGFQAGYLVQAAEGTILLDCGASTLTSMKRRGIDAACVDTVILSHLHGDHFAGLPYLFLEYKYEQPRSRPLRIAGPPGTKERVWALYRAAYRELADQPMPFALEFVEMPPSVPAVVGTVRIEPFRVPHQESDISLAVRVLIGGRVVLYSGDTGWNEDLIRHSEGTDLFICECCFFETRLPVHLDYPRIAEHRERFGARRMILTHLGREVHAHRSEIEVELASDGLRLEVP